MQADVGSTITVNAQYTDDQTTAENVTATTATTVTNVNDVGSVAITGTATQGQTLTATVSDDDGVPGSITYQWKRGSTTIGTNSATYVLVQADVGSTITVNAQYADDQTTAENVTATTATTVEGVVMTVDGVTYSTVQIGEQIWTAENMRHHPGVGTFWNADSSSDYSDGSYYTWEAATYVCQRASGWRLPSDEDWKVLEGHLGMSVEEQNTSSKTNWRGTDQGTQLKVGGTSGFEAKLAGYYLPGGIHALGVASFLWSSTEHSTWWGPAYSRQMNANIAKVIRTPQGKAHGFSVRCLKD